MAQLRSPTADYQHMYLLPVDIQADRQTAYPIIQHPAVICHVEAEQLERCWCNLKQVVEELDPVVLQSLLQLSWVAVIAQPAPTTPTCTHTLTDAPTCHHHIADKWHMSHLYSSDGRQLHAHRLSSGSSWSEEKEKTMLLSVIQEKLLVNLSFPVTCEPV